MTFSFYRSSGDAGGIASTVYSDDPTDIPEARSNLSKIWAMAADSRGPGPQI
jgi:hypothetical protein